MKGRRGKRKVRGLRGFGPRIQELRKAENAYRLAKKIFDRERERFLNVFDSMEDGVYIVDEDYNILYVNKALRREFGSPKKIKCYEYFHDRKESCPWCKREKILAGESVRWEWHSPRTGKTYDVIDTPLRNPDGSIYKVEILRDITPYKVIEKALRETEERYKSLAETSPDCIKLFDLEGHLLYINQGGLGEHGLKNVEEARKWDYMSCMIDEDREIFRKGFERAVKGEGNTIEIHHTHEGSDREVCLETMAPVKDAGGHVRYVFGVSRDISALKAIEEHLKRLNRHKDNVVSIAAHELRTPLAITKEGLGLVLDEMLGKLSDQQRTMLHRVSIGNDRLIRIANSLLDTSKLESESYEIKWGRFDLKEVIEEVVGDFKRQAEKKGLLIQYEIACRDTYLYADRDKVIQILFNLVNNALKYTSRGSVTVCLHDQGDRFRFEVRDTGEGIPKEKLPRVFQKFQRFSEKPESSAERGAGLGLFICRELVHLHGGQIEIESEYGKGTSFIFTLPRRLPV